MLPDDSRPRAGDDTHRRSPQVVHVHPLVALPPIVAAVAIGMTAGPQAAQRTLLVAGGGALLVELATRTLVRRRWARGLWPPAAGEPAGLIPVAAIALWALAWSVAAPSTAGSNALALEAGARASWWLAAIQFTAWVVAGRHPVAEPPPVSERPRGAVARHRAEED